MHFQLWNLIIMWKALELALLMKQNKAFTFIGEIQCTKIQQKLYLIKKNVLALFNSKLLLS